MSTVRLRNINPLGYVDLPLIGRAGPAPYLVCLDPDSCHPEHEHDQLVDEDGTGVPAGVGCLVPGEVFEVDAKLAGHAPSGTPGQADWDPGEGLLAQVGNYEFVKPPKKATAKKTAAKKTAAAPAEDDTAKGGE